MPQVNDRVTVTTEKLGTFRATIIKDEKDSYLVKVAGMTKTLKKGDQVKLAKAKEVKA